jgi:hypothetical protein
MYLTSRQLLLDQSPEAECEGGWDCRACAHKKRELEQNEDDFIFVREKLSIMADHLSSHCLDYSQKDLNLAFRELCLEFGIKFNGIIERFPYAKLYEVK